jgi:predicted PurR-regulated permease PerM
VIGLGYFICRQVQQQLLREVDQRHRIIEEREKGIQHIEKTIVEVNQIYQDLAFLIGEQGAMIGACCTLLSVAICKFRYLFIVLVCLFFCLAHNHQTQSSLTSVRHITQPNGDVWN